MLKRNTLTLVTLKFKVECHLNGDSDYNINTAIATMFRLTFKVLQWKVFYSVVARVHYIKLNLKALEELT